MLFEHLLVQNLGVFRGEHSLNLLPPDPAKPIVLVGALNGSGKTTVIEAFQLALYGKRANFGWRNAGSYLDYLERVRNRHAKQSELTVVEVALRLSDGRKLRVRRHWSVQKGPPKEYIAVFLDGSDQPDLALSENWDDEIERLLPARLAELFFFDGERIEELADPMRSAGVLRAAVSSLLGLDLVDHLVADLEILRSRQKQKQLSDVDKTQLMVLDREQNTQRQKLEDARQERSRLKVRVEVAKRELNEIDQSLQAQGGDRFRQRERLIANRAESQAGYANCERQLRELAGGPTPLLLIKNQLKRILVGVSHKADSMSSNSAADIAKYLNRLLAWTKDRKYPVHVQKEIRSFIHDELKNLKTMDANEGAFDWPHLKQRLTGLLVHRLNEAREVAVRMVGDVRMAAEELHTLDEQLAQVPEHEQLAEAFRKQGAAMAVLEKTTADLHASEALEVVAHRNYETIKGKRLDQLEKAKESEDAARLAEYCQRSIGTLAAFRLNLVRMRREQLERLILEAFQMLSRKADLIGHIKLDPETMAITLQASDGAEMFTQQLSAGERQLLAVAMLWGLARASGRPVPVIIDTPLGRLDGEHRKTLVERYFPEAGHQVILLSTDTEVDADFSDLLEKSVAHRYLIGYDASKRSSSFVPGYFAR
jgi:DNA sulfur modification protein DndD